MRKKNFTNILRQLEPISLDLLNEKLCMSRFETKYLIFPHLLPDIIEELKTKYRILCINNLYIQEYESLYFDNQGFKFYLDHHNGKLNRFKVRFRKYLEVEKYFFEIKYKNNKSQTIKWREPIDYSQFGKKILTKQNSQLMNTLCLKNPGQLFPRLCVSYSRIALIHKKNKERVTIDLNLSYIKENIKKDFGNISIAEIKLGAHAQHSDFSDVMHELNIIPLNFSKYCFGIHLFYPTLKYNCFKSRYLMYNRFFNGRSEK